MGSEQKYEGLLKSEWRPAASAIKEGVYKELPRCIDQALSKEAREHKLDALAILVPAYDEARRAKLFRSTAAAEVARQNFSQKCDEAATSNKELTSVFERIAEDALDVNGGFPLLGNTVAETALKEHVMNTVDSAVCQGRKRQRCGSEIIQNQIRVATNRVEMGHIVKSVVSGEAEKTRARPQRNPSVKDVMEISLVSNKEGRYDF